MVDSKMSRYPSLQFSSLVAFHGSPFSQFQKDRFTLNLAASLAVVQDLTFGWIKFSLSLFPFWQLCVWRDPQTPFQITQEA